MLLALRQDLNMANDAVFCPTIFSPLELMEALFRKKQWGGHISDSSRNDNTT
jgi:hypothetical protein